MHPAPNQSSLHWGDGKEMPAMGASRVVYASLCEYTFKDMANLQTMTDLSVVKRELISLWFTSVIMTAVAQVQQHDIQMDLDKLEDWANRNIMKSSVEKHKVLHIRCNSLEV